MGIDVKIGSGVIPPKSAVPLQRNFPNFLEAYLDCTKNLESTEKMNTWTALSIVGAAMGRKVWLPEEHFTLFPNLYTIIVADPGIFRKSTTTNIGIDMLREIPGVNIPANSLTDASLVDNLSRYGDKFIYNGSEIKHSSALFYASELPVLLKNPYGNIAELLTDFYDCTPYNSNVPWRKETKGGGEVKIHGPCASLIGCATPSSLKECIPVSQMEAGLASRIIFVIETGFPVNLCARTNYNAATELMKQKLIEDLTMINDMAGPMVFTSDADEYFTLWYKEHKTALKEREGDRRFAGYFGRKDTHVKKVSAILSACEGNSRVITIRHVAAAVMALDGLEKEMLSVFAGHGRNINADVLIQMLDYTKAKKQVTEGTLHGKFFRQLNFTELKSAIEHLVAMRQIQLVSDGKTTYYAPIEGAQNLDS